MAEPQWVSRSRQALLRLRLLSGPPSYLPHYIEWNKSNGWAKTGGGGVFSAFVAGIPKDIMKDMQYWEAERPGTNNVSPETTKSDGSLVSTCGCVGGKETWRASKHVTKMPRGNVTFEIMSLLCNEYTKFFYMCGDIRALSHVRFSWKKHSLSFIDE